MKRDHIISYVFMPVFPQDEELAEKICYEFRRRTYWMSGYELILIVDNTIDIYHYLGKHVDWYNNRGKIRFLLKNEINIYSIITDADYYIAGHNPDEANISVQAFLNDVCVKPSRKIEEIFHDIQQTEESREMWSEMDLLFNRDIVFKFPVNKYEYIIAGNGAGDVMPLFLSLPARYKKTQKKIVVLMPNDKNHSVLTKDIMLRCSCVSTVIIMPPAMTEYIICYKQKFILADFRFLSFEKECLFPQNTENYPIGDYYAAISRMLYLDINSTFKKEKIKLRSDEIGNAQKWFQRLGLREGKTVYLVTEGVTFPMEKELHMFWLNCITKLRKAGYNVVVNGKKTVFEGVPNVFLPFGESVSFLAMCGNLLTVSTGISESLCGMITNKSINTIFVWPDMSFKYWKNAAKHPWAGNSIKSYGTENLVTAVMKGQSEYVRRFLSDNIHTVDMMIYKEGYQQEERSNLIVDLFQRNLGDCPRFIY